jgi:protein-tyrosine kinase
MSRDIEKAVDQLSALGVSNSVDEDADEFFPSDSLDIVESASDPTEDFTYTRSTVVRVSDEILRKNHVLTPDMDNATVVAYKTLRTRVLRRMEQNGWSSLAITSPNPDEGKTLTAINLGISLAQKLDYTVLLVDLDFRKPSLHKYFGFEPQYGLNDYLDGRVSLEKVFVNPGIDRLLLLPAGVVESNSSEMLSSTKMEKLVADLKSRYASRLLLFDLPPVLVGDDTLAFSTLADAVMLLAREGKTTTDDLQRTVELLETKNLLGVVLNRSLEENMPTYGY